MKEKTKKRISRKNNKIQVFFIFLGLATILWFISKLSKDYTHTVKANTVYINLTNDKKMQNKPINQIEMVLKTSGFNLLGYTIFNKKIKIDLSKTHQKGNAFYYLTNQNISSLQEQLAPDETLLSIYPDTLFFDFGKLSSKKIPVKLNTEFNYKTGYNLVNNLEIEPKYIIINGTKQQLSKIKAIQTVKFEKKDISSNFDFTLALDIPKEYNNIRFSSKEIHIKGTVGKFTEASKELSYKVINLPKDAKIETLVKTVKVKYKVSLENYDKINKTDFKVVCDYKKINTNSHAFLIPELVEKPNLISNVKISPNKIEFLIKK